MIKCVAKMEAAFRQPRWRRLARHPGVRGIAQYTEKACDRLRAQSVANEATLHKFVNPCGEWMRELLASEQVETDRLDI
jgi:hypothetical protein